MTTLPLVTVVVPARNEAVDIEACLTAIATQDYPLTRLEIFVIDGCSPDGTGEIAKQTLARWPFAATEVLENPVASTSSNLNVGLRRARGDILCRVDARTRIEAHYVRTCVAVLTTRYDVSVVGGAQVAVARDASHRARGIARALNNRWSMGGSRYRRSSVSGEADTVYLGAFRTRQLLDAGGWDEALESNQDFDLNRRMSVQGAVWFESSLQSSYVPRATFAELWRQYRRFGRAKVQYWTHSGDQPQVRQYLLLLVGPVVATAMMAALVTRRLPLFAGALAIGVAAVDGVGSSGPAPVRTRAMSCLAIAMTSAGWSYGAWSQLVRRMLSRLAR